MYPAGIPPQQACQQPNNQWQTNGPPWRVYVRIYRHRPCSGNRVDTSWCMARHSQSTHTHIEYTCTHSEFTHQCSCTVQHTNRYIYIYDPFFNVFEYPVAWQISLRIPKGKLNGFGIKLRWRQRRTPAISEFASNIKILQIINKAGLFHILFGLIKFWISSVLWYKIFKSLKKIL